MRAIDLFAGGGGFTAGAVRAGADVLWAANHWPTAVEYHARNHPEVEHACQDLLQADWRFVPDHDLLLASPACQGHSQAGQPGRSRSGVLSRQQMDRNTAWAVVSCAEVKRPEAILVENVADFLRWPLFPAWRHALELLGYTVREHVFDASDFGTPQNRRRAVVSARLGAPLDLRSPTRDHAAFADHLELDAGSWRPWREVAERWPGVGRRIGAALERGLGPRFLTHYVTGHRGRELHRPIGCVTTKAQWAVVDGERMRMLTTTELRRAMDFPDDYALPEQASVATRLLGNAIPVRLSEEIVRQAVEASR